MSSSDIRQLKPFLSLLFIISTLLGLVFIKMDERRLSYVVLKSTRDFKKINETARQKEIALAKLLRPQLVETVAMQRLTMRKIKPAQIINLSSANLTIKALAQNKTANESQVYP
ncbi:MAG: histidine kinase [Pseudobdellovibrio sp.]